MENLSLPWAIAVLWTFVSEISIYLMRLIYTCWDNILELIGIINWHNFLALLHNLISTENIYLITRKSFGIFLKVNEKWKITTTWPKPRSWICWMWLNCKHNVFKLDVLLFYIFFLFLFFSPFYIGIMRIYRFIQF